MFSQQNPKQTGPRENVLLQHACAFTKDSRYLLSMSFVLHIMAVPIGWPLSSVNTLSYSPERSACSPSLHGYILYPAGLAALISPACRIELIALNRAWLLCCGYSVLFASRGLCVCFKGCYLIGLSWGLTQRIWVCQAVSGKPASVGKPLVVRVYFAEQC